MATLNESPRTGGFLLSEANGTLSRATVTLAAGNGTLAAGTVLGKITVGGQYAPYDDGVDPADGTQTAAAILWAAADTTAATPAVVIYQDAEVAQAELVGIDSAGVADLAALNIRCK